MPVVRTDADRRLDWINVGPVPLPGSGRRGDLTRPCEPTLPAGRVVTHSATTGGGGTRLVAHGDRLFCITAGGSTIIARAAASGRARLVDLLRESHTGLDAADNGPPAVSHTVVNHHGVHSDDTTALLVDSTSRQPPPLLVMKLFTRDAELPMFE